MPTGQWRDLSSANMQKTQLPRVSTPAFKFAGGDAQGASKRSVAPVSAAAPQRATQPLLDAFADIRAADHAGILSAKTPQSGATGVRCEKVPECCYTSDRVQRFERMVLDQPYRSHMATGHLLAA